MPPKNEVDSERSPVNLRSHDTNMEFMPPNPKHQPTKDCRVGHRRGAAQSIFFRNLCDFPKQGDNSNLPMCDDHHNTQIEPSSYGSKNYDIDTGNSQLLTEKTEAIEENNSNLPLCDNHHNTQIEPSSDRSKSYAIDTGNSQFLIQKIEEAIEENKRMLDKSILQKTFDMVLRPVLAPRLLILPNAISDPCTLFLHDQYFLENHKEPSFLSSYEITSQMKRIDDPEEWDKFMSIITSRRVFVANDWVSNIGNIETTFYYHSIKGAKDVEFYRGEIDASFYDGVDGPLGTAVLSFVVKKGVEPIHAEIFEDVPCPSIHAAEAYAVLALFFYCSENGIKDLELWTDNNDIHGSICGSLTVRGDRKDRDLLLLLRSGSTKFNKLISMNKRREQLFLADDLAQSTRKSKAAVCMEDYLKKWDYELRGKALFRLSQSPSFGQILKDLSSYDHLGLFTIILVGPEEKALLDPKIKEASALTYVYFQVRTGNRTARAGQTKATGNAKTGQKKATGNGAGQKKATGNVAGQKKATGNGAGQKKAAGNAYAGQKKKR